MVAPVTGPIITNRSQANKWYEHKQVYKQAMPIDRPLPYTIKSIRTLVATGNEATNDPNGSSDFSASLQSNPLVNQTRIRAYDKLKEKLGDRAELLVTLSEYNKAIDTVGQLSMTLYKVARSFKRGLSRPMWDSLRQVKVRELGQTQLAISYGVIPTVQDLYNAVNILQSPVPDGHIKASSRGTLNERFSLGGSSYSRYLTRRNTEVICGYGTDISVSNKNLYLANQLGLVNPFTFLTERTPLSFVLGWFVNIDQFMAMGTDFLGLSLKNSYSSTRIVQRKRFQWTSYGWVKENEQNDYVRTTGIVTPSLGFRQLRPWGWRRAANAVSLLTNHLRSF